MKELFTKSFWQGVKKTYDEALEDHPTVNAALQDSAKLNVNPCADTLPAPVPPVEQQSDSSA